VFSIPDSSSITNNVERNNPRLGFTITILASIHTYRSFLHHPSQENAQLPFVQYQTISTMKSPSSILFAMKSPSYLVMLLSFATSVSSATVHEEAQPQIHNNRHLEMTQAQKFASQLNQRATSIKELKAGLPQEMTSKLSLDEAFAVGNSHGWDRPRTIIDASKIKAKSGNAGSGKKDQVKNDKEEIVDSTGGGSIAHQMIQKLGETKIGDDAKKEEGRGDMEGRAGSLASAALDDLSN
jgi:hypothetical protein